MSKETGRDTNELGIRAWIIYDGGTMPDFRIVISYIPHKMDYPRSNGTVYQKQRTFLISMGKTRCPFRVYEEDILTQFPQ